MFSTSLGKKQRRSRWEDLPREVRLLILQCLMQDSRAALGRLATVSREWQAQIERYNFARIRLTPSRLVDFGTMIRRNRALVGYIWLCFELDEYDCTTCVSRYRRTFTDDEWGEVFAISDTDKCPITTTFQNLFAILSTWDPHGDLTLDISIYSLSDLEHCFPYLTFVPDTPSDMPGDYGIMMEKALSRRDYHDPQHGWVAGSRHSAPFTHAINKVFHEVMEQGPFDSDELELQWWDQLPSVPAVTSVLLRQQNRRRWKPDSLAHLFARFPRLQEVHYEPWREWAFVQRCTDKKYQYFFESIQRSNSSLKRLVVFENFNQRYPVTMRRFDGGDELTGCERIRTPAPAVGQTVALASLKLEHLAASFIADASHFFEVRPAWEWPNLTSLVITSRLLTPDEDPVEVGAMLRAAAAAAMKMPRLETMEIWNGRKGLAALFRYQALRNMHEAVIVWRGTWKLAVEPSTIQAWEAVMHQYHDGWRIELVQERLDEAVINSHGDAIRYLMLLGQVVRPVSLQQIQIEQEALEGVDTIS
ncbi:hypothetical protein CTA2_4680 [Colletotrichum tanaceti]|nr:hypothetical protein CTA2_4680 [Colletotrichum tanaceti]